MWQPCVDSREFNTPLLAAFRKTSLGVDTPLPAEGSFIWKV